MTAFLKARNVEPPYVLIGHSLGGHIERYYAEKHPKEVAGLVFIDHPHEDWFRYIRAIGRPRKCTRILRVLDGRQSWLRRNGQGRAIGVRGQLHDLVRGMKIHPDMPVLMFTGSTTATTETTRPDVTSTERPGRHAGLAARRRHGCQAIVDWECGHMLHKDKPEMVERRSRRSSIAFEPSSPLADVRRGFERAFRLPIHGRPSALNWVEREL